MLLDQLQPNVKSDLSSRLPTRTGLARRVAHPTSQLSASICPTGLCSEREISKPVACDAKFGVRQLFLAN